MVQDFRGALLVVSHDDVFPENIGLTHRLIATAGGWRMEMESVAFGWVNSIAPGRPGGFRPASAVQMPVAGLHSGRPNRATSEYHNDW